MKIFQGTKPDVTPAQILGALVAGIPVLATVLEAFGVYDLTAEQQDALTKAVQWAGILAVALFGADAGLRASRNHADARVQSAGLVNPNQPPTIPGEVPAAAVQTPLVLGDDLRGAQAAQDPSLPSDEQEFGVAGTPSANTTIEGEEELSDGQDELDPTLPTDEEEFADGGPDDDSGPESRTRPDEELL